jgi:linoleoyl-CoA desaturase
MQGKVKFINPHPQRDDFYFVLRKRVNEYFETSQRSKFGDLRMYSKTAAMFAMFFVPYALILSNTLSPWAMLLGAVVMGFGVAGIGLSIMHDANHGAYSSHPTVNKLMGLSLNLVGACAFNWKIQHNVMHHMYTNIHGLDEDIRDRPIIRLTPHAERFWWHRFQHLYALLIYGLQTVDWVLTKDFTQLVDYYRAGVIKKRELRRELLILSATKLLYIFYIVVLPLWLVDITWWQWLIGFLTMHYITGLTLAVIFQVAHVIEETAMPLRNEEGNIENLWAIHQMETTANFANDNKLLNWYVGGLNFQVEHHLFPRICHVHYPAISRIVKETAEEYGVPYHQKKTLVGAVASHLRLLKRLGTTEARELAGVHLH